MNYLFKLLKKRYKKCTGSIREEVHKVVMSALPSEVTLISEDGIKFQVRIQVVRCIGLFKNLLELHMAMPSSSGTLPPLKVPNVNSLILDKIIEYLNSYTSSKENSALTKPNGLKVKNIISGIHTVNNVNEDDEDEESAIEADDDGDGEIQITRIIEEDEFEMKENDETGEDENVFDFANFDEQSLKLFTPYEQNFFGSLDIPTLIEITKAANYMHIPHLLDSCCKAIANHMKGLSVEELRTKFNIKNDFTPEEEERVRKETAWIDE